MRVGNNLCTPTWTAIAPPILDEKGEKKEHLILQSPIKLIVKEVYFSSTKQLQLGNHKDSRTLMLEMIATFVLKMKGKCLKC